ncbi:MAG: HAMP domain-containing histidine kinase [Chitinophaga sp.]|uniref:sensor histidine kinase n=1 Tax=Chitinophaga sp. TaxID=1869181 RepID=UPI0025C68908|nr:HAMP domain-containing sensor histidine kinase [Chitinophaga sp.]MBV8252251.1 HAMP domain-containing histidine kinase [Chitinophaga sp.]
MADSETQRATVTGSLPDDNLTREQLLLSMYALSHTLQNKLSNIFAAWNNYRLAPSNPAETLEEIMIQVQAMKTQVNNIYRFSKPQEDNLVKDICSIADYCSTAFSHYRQQAELQHRTLTTSFFPKGSIYTDTSRLDLILDNVFSNAIRYAPINTNVHMEVAFFAGVLMMTVTNQFDHFPEDRLQDIFQPAVQLDHHHTGCGLGLYICQKNIQLLGGTISATCTPQTFSIAIRLPAV